VRCSGVGWGCGGGVVFFSALMGIVTAEIRIEKYSVTALLSKA